ncbi:MAG: type VI secretion system tip protein TssI/VgrG [Isosphaeraceae bacterium]
MAVGLQDHRSMAVATPLPFNTLLLMGFRGEEGISQLFRFRLDLAAHDANAVDFDRLLGRPVSIRLTLPAGKVRYFSGICSRMNQGLRTTETTSFGMEVVPAAWVLSRRTQSRIFQGASVPDILRAVLRGVPDVTFDLRGHYPPRDFCVQYRETDLNFMSRLMEEEGIYYFFKHRADAHEMVISDRDEFPALDPSQLVLQAAGETLVTEHRITHWEKSQELGFTKVMLRDHTFELPHQTLEAVSWVPETIDVGRVEHRLRTGKTDRMELYDWPGEYAQRFDGIDRRGDDRPRDLEEIFRENQRTADIRAKQEAVAAVTVRGAGRYRHLCSGHSFELRERVPDTYRGPAVHDGRYVITSVSHVGRVGESYRTGGTADEIYHNSFTCLPASLPFRPQRTTPRPVVQGAQSAVVVGPVGEEIHTDKYGRVRVKFHWDREAQGDDSSSCWIRVAQIVGGGLYSAAHIPRVGQEVLVQFEEGDPDRPVITGSVYNPTHMPPYELPDNKMISGLRTNSYPGGGGYNEIIVNDTKGGELIRIHGQHDMDTTVLNDLRENVLHDRTRSVTNNESVTIGVNQSESVGNNQTESVQNDKTVTVGGNETTSIGGNQSLTVVGNQTEMIGSNRSVSVGANDTVSVAANRSNMIGANLTNAVGATQNDAVALTRNASIGMIDSASSGLITNLSAGLVMALSAGVTLTLTGPGGMIQIGPGGIEIRGKQVIIQGNMVQINP